MSAEVKTDTDKQSQPAAEPASSLALAEAAQLRHLDPAKVRFFKVGADLRVTLEGELTCLRTSVVRCFPLTHEQRYLSVRDGGGKEIGMIVDRELLDPESRRLVGEEVDRRYIIAKIRKIRGVMERFGIVEWDVETDRGQCAFSTRDLRENTLRLSLGRYLLQDAEGNRFEVVDIDALDSQSKMWLLLHL